MLTALIYLVDKSGRCEANNCSIMNLTHHLEGLGTFRCGRGGRMTRRKAGEDKTWMNQTPAAKGWDRKIPFHVTTGTMLSYAANKDDPGTTWTPAVEFDATLRFAHYSRGRSSALLWFDCLDGGLGPFPRTSPPSYPFFMSDFELLVPHMVKGVITGRFIGTKKGSNFGLKLVEVL